MTMAGKQLIGEGLSSNMAGMSKNQLYDIMSQMKTLIEQNQQQARDILIQNPLLTKALFQAQIMLGMVQPPQVMPNIQPTASQHPQQATQPIQQSNIQAPPSLPGHTGLPDKTTAPPPPNPVRKQQQTQPVVPVTVASVPPPLHVQSQSSLSSHPLQSTQQPKGHLNVQAPPMSLPQSHVPHMPPLHSASQPPSLQSQMPTASTQMQQPLQTSGILHLPQQPPLPPQPRPPSMPPFSHQIYPQMGPNAGFQHSGAPQLHHSQPMYHSGIKPPPSMGPSFSQGQPPLPSQPPPQSLYQGGGSHLGMDFSQGGSSMQAERGSAWMPDNNPVGPPPPQFIPNQMGAGNQAPRAPPPLTPDMEKALLQQVMSLTPEQINLLPPDQRNQVLQLQQMLRQ